jgi:hypothetical protein
MKATIEHEKQVLALTRAYQKIALTLVTKVAHSTADFVSQVQALTRIYARDVRDIYAPVKKGAKNHGVRVRRNR